MNTLWTAQELEYVRENYSTKTNLQIAIHLGRTKKAVDKQAENMKLRKTAEFRNKINGANRRVRFFDIDVYKNGVDSCDKAYLLGFIQADGYMYNKRGELRIRLHPQDKDLLLRIKEFLNSNVELKYGKHGKGNKYDYVQMDIASYDFRDDLAKLGVVQAKSLISEWPNYLEDKYTPDYIRGYFDGDGCIIENKKNKYQLSILGTVDFLNGLQNEVAINTNTNPRNIHNLKDNKINGIAYSGGNLVPKVLNYIYRNYDESTDMLRLDRKADRCLRILKENGYR